MKYYIYNGITREYYKAPGHGVTKNIKEAHPYSKKKARARTSRISHIRLIPVESEEAETKYYIQNKADGRYWKQAHTLEATSIPEKAHAYNLEDAIDIATAHKDSVRIVLANSVRDPKLDLNDLGVKKLLKLRSRIDKIIIERSILP